MSHRFRPPPVDTDHRPFVRSMAPGAEQRGRMFRAPPPGARPPWAVRGPSHRTPPHWQPPQRPPLQRPPPEQDWPPHSPSEQDWTPRPHEPSDWSVSRPAASHLSPAAEGALGVLSSCGLDAEDLSALAELPEDLLTLKSLPLLLKQIKGLKKDPGPSGYLPPGRTPIPQYDQSEALYAGPAPRRDMDKSVNMYRDPGPSKADFSSSVPGGSSFVVEYGHCTASQDTRKSPERPRHSSPGFTTHGSKEFRRSVERTPLLGAITLSSIPSETEARDFHGMKPSAFPYSCSLCDITVLSDFVWTQHVTSTLHADSQLALLQRFPSWDCRLSSVRKSDDKQPKELAKKPAKKTKKETTTTNTKKLAKVVCVKFPPQSVDEFYIRKLLAVFGRIVHVAMFPSLGFVELETPEQAHLIIDHYTKTPHKVKDREVEFTISTTFNFLQSSFVLKFHPFPFGKDGQSDLVTIIKRFGMPRYTMFLPKRMEAYVEMQSAADAHKMVEFYSDNPLKMNGVDIKVSFSQEYRNLERCVTARPYDNKEPNSSKKEDESHARTSPAKERHRSRGKSQGKSPARSVRSVSSERHRRERSSASRNRSKPGDSKPGDSKPGDSKPGDSKPGDSKPGDSKPGDSKPGDSKPADSKPADSKPADSKPADSKPDDSKPDDSKPDDSKPDDSKPDDSKPDDSKPDSKPGPEAEAKQGKEPLNQSEEESDIEGMQVVGEQIDDENTDCPPDLRYCITLDEVSDLEEAEAEPNVEEEDEDSPRVVYIGNLPMCKFSDPQFIKMVTQVHRPVRYFINRPQRMGLVEFKSQAESRGFVAQMQNYSFGGSCIDVFISNKYNRLPWGRGVEYDEFGRIVRHFRVGNSPKREGKQLFYKHSQLEGSWASHKYPQIEVTDSHRRSRSRGRSHGRSRDRSRGKSRGRSRDGSRGKSRGRSRDGSRGKSRCKSRERSRDGSRGKSKGRSRDGFRDRSRDKSRDKSRDRSKGQSRSKSAEKSRETDKMDTREKSKSPPPQEKPLAGVDESQAMEEPATADDDEEGWVVHEDMAKLEDDDTLMVKIENVVSLKDLGDQKQESEDVAESKDALKNEQELKEEEESCDQAEESGNEQVKAPKRKGGAEAETGAECGQEKKLKQDSMTTEGGTAETRRPSEPIGTEFLLLYCDLCHVKISDDQEARVSHCSSHEHYLKYQEVTGKDPWSC